MNLTKNGTRVFSVICLVILCVVFSKAQKSPNFKKFDNCETIAWKLDTVGNDVSKTNEKTVLIIIELQPKNTSLKKSKSRLRNAKKYLVKHFGIPSKRIITAIGDGDETELANVRFYFGGELRVEVSVAKNSVLCLVPEGDFASGT